VKTDTVKLTYTLVILVLGSLLGHGFLTIDAQASSDDYPIGTGFVSASGGLPAATSQHSVWFGDINNDNSLDIATAGYSGIRVWTGDGAGNWILASTGLPNSAFDGGVCLGDIDNDQKLDLVAANYNYGVGGVGVWTGDGAGSWTPASTGLPTDRWHTGVFLADINHDDNLDLAVAKETNSGYVKVFTGDGAGVWTDSSTNLPTDSKNFGVWMGDVNNDNHTDLAVAGTGVHVFLGDGAGVWTEASNGLPWTDQWNGVALGDINLDGNLDIVATMDGGGLGLRAWLGDGTGNWSLATAGLPTTGTYFSVVLADMVGDKYPDILAAGYGGDGIRIWKGDGGSTWTDASAGLPAGGVLGVAAGDIDNDGHLDIGAVGEGFGVQVWRNDATTPPLEVEVETPNGGEVWDVGFQESINWMASGGTPPLTMRIDYSVDGVLGQYTMISDPELNDGTFLWTIPNTPSSDCFVRINVTDSLSQTNWDKSNKSFTIYVPDTEPPTISNLQPVNESVIGDDMPVIRASYSDPSGIFVPSVKLIVDSVDVTSWPTTVVTTSEAVYTPAMPVPDGVHDVYLEVSDDSADKNMAAVAWWFVVDTLPPSISFVQPANFSTTGDTTPDIGASYSDMSGVNTSRVILKVDTVDVTSAAMMTASTITYTPLVPLTEGSHDVYLELADNSTPANVAIKTWWFVVDTLAPLIENLQPVNGFTTADNTPVIGASYSDPSGINTTSVILEVDSIDVTSSATVWMSEVFYTPPVPLSEGTHDVYLEVRDDSVTQNRATESWWFTVDNLAPIVSNLQPANQSIIGESVPAIVASYDDPSGIDISSVTLKVDSIDVTSSATVLASQIAYVPALPLSEGAHNVYLEVKDQSNPQNKVIETWWFEVDTLAPVITDMQPGNESITSDSLSVVSANYSDASGVDDATVVLKLDSVDVTSSASVKPLGITYTPVVSFPDGVHNLFLEVKDNSQPANTMVQTWWFSVDTAPPTITDLQPANGALTTNNTPVIGANYSDASGIDTANIVLRLNDIDVTGSAIIEDNKVTLTWLAAMQDGVHRVNVTAKDVAVPSNIAWMNWSFTLDSTAPTISHNPVTSGTAGTDVTIDAEVTDDTGVSSVSLCYGETDSQSFDCISMTRTDGDLYTATIPASDVTTKGVEYYIEATDTLGNTGRNPKRDWDVSPNTIGISPSAEEFPYLFVIIGVVVAVIAALVLVLLLLRKKRKEKELT
jgi:hypothetical protein